MSDRIFKLIDKYRARGFDSSTLYEKFFKNLKNLNEKKRLTNQELQESLEFVTENYRKKIGQYITPISLTKFIVSLANIRSGVTVLDPTCGIGSFLFTSKQVNDNITCHGIDINSKIIESADFINDILGFDITYLPQNSLESFPKEVSKADIVFSNLPMGVKVRDKRLRKNFPVKSSSLESLLIQKSLKYLKENGLAFLVVPPAILFSRQHKKLREYIVSKFSLESIMEMPIGSIPDTSIRPFLLVISNISKRNETLLLELDSFTDTAHYLNAFKDHVENKQVNVGKVVKKFGLRDNWLPSKYYEQLIVEEQISEKEKEYDFIRMAEMASIQTKTVKDIKSGEDDYDLLLSSVYNPGKIINTREVLTKSDNARYYALKIDHSEYLVDFIRYFCSSNLFKSQVDLYATGQAIQGIKKAKLSAIKIPKINKEKQKKIIRAISEITEKITEHQARLKKIEKRAKEEFLNVDEIVSDMTWQNEPSLEDNLPSIISIPWQAALKTTDVDDKLRKLRVAYGNTLRFLSSIIILSASENFLERIKKNNVNSPMPGGLHVSIINEGLKRNAITRHFLKDYIADVNREIVKESLSNLSRLRNDEAHPAILSNKKIIKESSNAFEKNLSKLLSEFAFLTEYPLVYFESIRPKSHKITHVAKYLVGDSLNPKESEIKLKETFSSELWLLSNKYDQSINLPPFFLYEECPTCGVHEIFSFHKLEGRDALYDGCVKGKKQIFNDYLDKIEALFTVKRKR